MNNHLLSLPSWDPRDIVLPLSTSGRVADDSDVQMNLSDGQQGSIHPSYGTLSSSEALRHARIHGAPRSPVTGDERCFIDILPPEILVLIIRQARDLIVSSGQGQQENMSTRRFAYNNDDKTPWQWLATRFAIRLSHVARRWREVALETSSLWTLLWFSGRFSSRYHEAAPARIAAFANRAKSNPLDLQLYFAKDLTSGLVSSYATRVCSLKIVEGKESDLRFVYGLGILQAPLLRDLHIEVEPEQLVWSPIGTEDPHYPFINLHWLAPQLRKATFIYILPQQSQDHHRPYEPISVSWLSSCCPVTSMSVRTVGSRSGSLENLLSNCPHLQDLKLDDYQGPRLPTFFSPGFLRVELPFLRYLEVSYMCHDVAWTILTQWTIPQLTTLKLKAAPRPSGGERLQTTLLPLLSSVEHLHITGLGANKILVGSLFMSAPGLKTLAICDSSVNVRRAVSLMSTQGLSALSSDSSFTPPHPLPLNSLTALSIQTYADPAVENSNSGNGEIVTSRKAHLRRADGLKMTIEERRLTLKRVRVSDSSLVRKRLKQSLGEAGMKDIVIFHSTWNVPPLAKESGGPSNHE